MSASAVGGTDFFFAPIAAKITVCQDGTTARKMSAFVFV
jgi:hypothetical protein